MSKTRNRAQEVWRHGAKPKKEKNQQRQGRHMHAAANVGWYPGRPKQPDARPACRKCGVETCCLRRTPRQRILICERIYITETKQRRLSRVQRQHTRTVERLKQPVKVPRANAVQFNKAALQTLEHEWHAIGGAAKSNMTHCPTREPAQSEPVPPGASTNVASCTGLKSGGFLALDMVCVWMLWACCVGPLARTG